MANLIPGILKNRASQRLVRTLLISSQNPNLTSSAIPQLNDCILKSKPEIGEIPVRFLPQSTIENVELAKPRQFYPSFPFVLLPNLVFLPGSEPLGVEEADESDSRDGRTVRADSVKKKRKKKMNKHKYKKLRKRLRRKTRT